tara:strand:- start:1457 stop:2476 length:1020 start_codon:yes stop_codon:yes gene_type:complete
MQKNLSLSINIWLIVLAIIVLSMIAVGGLTRLTESGLSMVDWQLFMGIIPPLNQADWIKLFDDYKQYPEFQIKNLNMNIDEFKYIFWWEYGHRLLGRIIGLIFIIPFIYFALKKCFSKTEYKFYFVLLFLGGFQGFIGWWMVKSGLDMNPYVSHIRLAVHLIIAQIILVLIFFQLLSRNLKGQYQKISNRHMGLFIVFNIIILLTVIYGAFMAGLDAGKSFNTWPKMGDNYIPESLFFWEERFFGVFENSIFIHFFHRFLAYSSIIAIILIVWSDYKKIENHAQKLHLLAICILVFIQLVIGVFVVLTNVQISLGSIHQIVGTLLFIITSSYSLSILKY